MTLPAILDDCLRRLQAGETIAACLDHYPDQASELAPLLTAAARLRPLAGQRLSDAQRAQGRAVVRAAARTQSCSCDAAPQSARLGVDEEPGVWPGHGRRSRTVLVLALAGTTVLASQPGDVSYPLRVVAERAPAALQPSPAGRANAELRIADRRLDDLESHLRATRQVEAAALAALIRGDEAAARRAIDLPETQRRLVAQRIERHAAAILRLADRAETPAIEISAATRSPAAWNWLRPGCAWVNRRPSSETRPDWFRQRPLLQRRSPRGRPRPRQREHLSKRPRLDRLRFQRLPRRLRHPRHGQSRRRRNAPEPPTAQPDAPAATSTATSQPGRTDTATPTQVIQSTPTPIATTGATTIVASQPHRRTSHRSHRTPRPSRTPRPPITPRPTRTPMPPLTPRPTRTPRPPLTPRPQPTIQPTEITGANADPDW